MGKNNQNKNESYNSTLCQLAPKHRYNSKDSVEIATWISVAVFNDGAKALLMILVGLGLRVGQISMNFCQKTDDRRKIQSNRRSTDSSKDGRIEAKKRREDDQQRFEEEEGLLYGAGIAD